jgi:hypothetical protein
MTTTNFADGSAFIEGGQDNQAIVQKETGQRITVTLQERMEAMRITAKRQEPFDPDGDMYRLTVDRPNTRGQIQRNTLPGETYPYIETEQEKK